MAGFLIIEDERPIQQLLKRLIGNMGHGIIVASDGETGCKLAQDNEFDVILTDLHLPGTLTGMGLVRKIREAQPTCAVVIVSGHPSDDILEECKTLGITDFLSKPFELSFLRSVVDNILKRKESPADAGPEA